MKVEYKGKEYDLTKNTNIVLNEHRLEILGGELFCSCCHCVWPCPTRVVLYGLSELLQEKSDSTKKEKEDE